MKACSNSVAGSERVNTENAAHKKLIKIINRVLFVMIPYKWKIKIFQSNKTLGKTACSTFLKYFQRKKKDKVISAVLSHSSYHHLVA